MSRSLLSEEICPDLCIYMAFMNTDFLNMIYFKYEYAFLLHV